jgi:VWFA-related protein
MYTPGIWREDSTQELRRRRILRSGRTNSTTNFAALLFTATCLAQSTGGSDPPKQPSVDGISTSVSVVTAPTTVRTKSGEFITNLQVQDFEVYDNDKVQKITADLRDSPFSMVVAIQRSADMTGMLPKVQRIGAALTDLVAGNNAEIAVVGFDHSVEVTQDFTGDGDKVSLALMNLKTGSYSHAAIDAVMKSVQMLQNRPPDRHRVILVVSQKWDRGSHASLHEALLQAQFANVTIYSLNVSTLAAETTSEPMPQRPPPVPFIAQHVPSGASLTPTTMDQNYYLGNWVPLLVNIFHSAEDVVTDNTLEVLTRFTGGDGYSFHSDRSIGKALQDLSDDLHSQYLLSYSPSNLDEGGFHQIRVVVKRTDLRVRTRPGYWIPGKP